MPEPTSRVGNPVPFPSGPCGRRQIAHDDEIGGCNLVSESLVRMPIIVGGGGVVRLSVGAIEAY